MPSPLLKFNAVLFDLDGVLTPTAELHMRAWRHTFEELFAATGVSPQYTDRDYFDYLDGKKRYDGVASMLASRDQQLPWGEPSDAPEEPTVCGIGNRKNLVFSRMLTEGGIAPYPGSLRLLDELTALPLAVVSSSKNAEEVLRASGLRDRFRVVVDGAVAERESIPSKPAPEIFLRAAELLGVEPARAAAVEDAISGVESAAAGGFGLVVGVDRGTGAEALRAAGAHAVVRDLSELRSS